MRCVWHSWNESQEHRNGQHPKTFQVWSLWNSEVELIPKTLSPKHWWKCFATYKSDLFVGNPCGYPCCFTEPILLLFLRNSVSLSSSPSLRIGGFWGNGIIAEWPWCKNVTVPAQDTGFSSLLKNVCIWQFYCNLLWVWNKMGGFLWFDLHFCTYIW